MTFTAFPLEPSISKIRSCQLKSDPMIELVGPWPVIVNVLLGKDDEFLITSSPAAESERR